MSKKEKLLVKVLAGDPNNIRFEELISACHALGFKKVRTSGSHRIYTHAEYPEALSLQPKKDGKAKPYQVRQFRGICAKYLSNE